MVINSMGLLKHIVYIGKLPPSFYISSVWRWAIYGHWIIMIVIEISQRLRLCISQMISMTIISQIYYHIIIYISSYITLLSQRLRLQLRKNGRRCKCAAAVVIRSCCSDEGVTASIEPMPMTNNTALCFIYTYVHICICICICIYIYMYIYIYIYVYMYICVYIYAYTHVYLCMTNT